METDYLILLLNIVSICLKDKYFNFFKTELLYFLYIKFMFSNFRNLSRIVLEIKTNS